VGSNGRNQIDRNKVKTFRLQQTGEPARVRRSLPLDNGGDFAETTTHCPHEAVVVVGGSRSGKEHAVNTGDPVGTGRRSCAQAPKNRRQGVRAAIVATMPGNSGVAKGGREANPGSDRSSEYPSVVPETDKQEGETLWKRHKAERGVWSQGMLEALERGVKGGKWFSLIDKVYAEQTLARSWEKVRSNAGACGVDGITIARFEKQATSRLLAVNEQLKQGRYQPLPIRRTWIPKPGSAEKRPLGIPAVVDRVVQTAMRMVLEPIFEREFAPQSYGFRPGRSCKDALRRVDELLKSGHTHVVDVDIKGFFDSIPHEPLMRQVGAHVADGRVLGLTEGFLKAKVMEDNREWEPTDGTPQGGVISPLLANIYLNPLDWLMVNRGWQMVRYADDMVVLCTDAQTAECALEAIRGWMTEMGLTLHPEKTRTVDMNQPGSHFDFLGYRFWKGRKGSLHRYVRPKSKRKLRQKLKPITKRANGHSMDALTRKLNLILKGWFGYYKHVHRQELIGMDGWVRGRLRGILRKRAKKRGKARGQDHQQWPNRYFDTLGLFRLETAQVKLTVS
jgi:RNA-directed DNA polymerase